MISSLESGLFLSADGANRSTKISDSKMLGAMIGSRNPPGRKNNTSKNIA